MAEAGRVVWSAVKDDKQRLPRGDEVCTQTTAEPTNQWRRRRRSVIHSQVVVRTVRTTHVECSVQCLRHSNRTRPG